MSAMSTSIRSCCRPPAPLGKRRDNHHPSGPAVISVAPRAALLQLGGTSRQAWTAFWIDLRLDVVFDSSLRALLHDSEFRADPAVDCLRLHGGVCDDDDLHLCK